jgi:hypothetical protein
LPILAPYTAINYTFSLWSDPASGPYTSSLSIPVFQPVTIQLCQVTVGPQSSWVLSFGDGTPSHHLIIGMGCSTTQPMYCNIIDYNYTNAGVYAITATVVPTNVDMNSSVIVNLPLNKIVVTVSGPANYQCKQNIHK